MSTKIFTGAGNPKFPKSKSIQRHDEYGKDKKGVEVCNICWNVYFKKEWHHPDAKLYEKKGVKGKELVFVTCPADQMASRGLYEGEIILTGVSPKNEFDLLHLVANYGKRALLRDPQDRIIDMEKTKNGFRITTTENQLAVRLAKKIKSVFKGANLSSIKYSSEPYEVVRIKIGF